ncbi:ABC transporter permease [Pseudoroseomonas ludipueritiae]|uniref:ABC transporter permease n=1 Tax=Pseudoroseomonas ludipueritiae TaxID=198093 RepID=A0ABR7RCZ7_9PROT|nr:ABC transporter permease [Pseudoroseomonas ludipueritiae]MBC9179310.1 ABC transporter permease [Pseudoroseomonas ludipueritiae]
MRGLLRRLLALVPVLLGVVLASFLLTRLLPGDPAVFFANSVTADAGTVAALRARMGLDLPLWQQFLAYLAQLARGDLGQSIQTGQPVAADLLQRLPASAELTLVALGAALLLALPLGIAAALRPGSVIDHACRLVSVAGVALPSFVTGLLMIYLFYFRLGLAPEPIGRLDPFAIPPPRVTGFLLLDTLLAGNGAGFLAAARQLVLPAATMALFALAPLARMTRAAMLDVLGSDFIRAAHAHGLGRRRIVFSYALRNALLPVVTTLGMVFSSMLGANVLVERVFAWPGIGSYALDALMGLDYAPVQGFMLVMAGLLVGVNLLVDLLSAIIDPRSGLLRDA